METRKILECVYVNIVVTERLESSVFTLYVKVLSTVHPKRPAPSHRRLLFNGAGRQCQVSSPGSRPRLRSLGPRLYFQTE